MIFLSLTIFGLILGIAIGDPFIGICAGLFFGAMFQGPWTTAKNDMSTPEGVEKTKRTIKHQDDYDNYWGFIDHDTGHTKKK